MSTTTQAISLIYLEYLPQLILSIVGIIAVFGLVYRYINRVIK